MPLTKHQILRYRIIDRELLKRKYVKSKDIQAVLLHEFDLQVCQKTIQNDINAMQYDSQLGYFAPIEYNQREKAYYYADPDYSILKFRLKKEEINSLGFILNVFKVYSRYGILKNLVSAIEKIESTIQVEQGLKSSASSVWERVQIEPISPMSKKTAQLIPQIIQAIEQKKRIRFEYKKFRDVQSTLRTCIPAWLKEYQHFWYMVGMDASGKLKTFALDRVLKLEILEEYGKVDNIDLDNYYHHCMGITAHDLKPEKILLAFDVNQGKYIKAVPIHHTQEIVSDGNDELRVKIHVIPSFELYAKLLSYGSAVEVISPECIRARILKMLEKAVNNYF